MNYLLSGGGVHRLGKEMKSQKSATGTTDGRAQAWVGGEVGQYGSEEAGGWLRARSPVCATLAPGYCLSFGEVLRAELTQDRKTKNPKATINNKTKKEKLKSWT